MEFKELILFVGNSWHLETTNIAQLAEFTFDIAKTFEEFIELKTVRI